MTICSNSPHFGKWTKLICVSRSQTDGSIGAQGSGGGVLRSPLPCSAGCCLGGGDLGHSVLSRQSIRFLSHALTIRCIEIPPSYSILVATTVSFDLLEPSSFKKLTSYFQPLLIQNGKMARLYLKIPTRVIVSAPRESCSRHFAPLTVPIR